MPRRTDPAWAVSASVRVAPSGPSRRQALWGSDRGLDLHQHRHGLQ